MVKEMKHLQKNTLYDLDQMLSSALQIILPLHLQNLKLLRPAV